MQGFRSLHGTAPPVHAPDLQASGLVQGLLSVQTPPSGPAGFWQLPLFRLQLFNVHGLLSLQAFSVPAQVPFWHVSCCVHGLLSSHGPPVTRPLAHLPCTQVSAVQGLLSLHWKLKLHLSLQPAMGANAQLPLASDWRRQMLGRTGLGVLCTSMWLQGENVHGLPLQVPLNHKARDQPGSP